MDKRYRRPKPHEAQAKRIRRKYGVSGTQARLIADLHYLGGDNG